MLLSRTGPGIWEGRRILAGDQQAGKTGWNHQLPGKPIQPRRSGKRWANPRPFVATVTLEVLVQLVYLLFNCHPVLSKSIFSLFSRIFRISGVELPYRQRSGQLLLPEEGIFRESSVQWLQPHHGRVQVRQSGERPSTGRIPASLSVAFKVLRIWILSMIVFQRSDDFEFIVEGRKMKVESVRINIDVSVRTLHTTGRSSISASQRLEVQLTCALLPDWIPPGVQKKQRGLRCHDPCMLETSPVGRSALFSCLENLFSSSSALLTG